MRPIGLFIWACAEESADFWRRNPPRFSWNCRSLRSQQSFTVNKIWIWAQHVPWKGVDLWDILYLQWFPFFRVYGNNNMCYESPIPVRSDSSLRAHRRSNQIYHTFMKQAHQSNFVLQKWSEWRVHGHVFWETGYGNLSLKIILQGYADLQRTLRGNGKQTQFDPDLIDGLLLLRS